MIRDVELRTPFNYDVDAVSEATGLMCLDESLAVQSEAEEADINTLVKRFGLTGQMPTAVRVPEYGDFDSVSNYHEAMSVIADANSAFMEFPADVRARFDNDPGKFVDFVSDERNTNEAIDLGIALPRAAELASAAPPAADARSAAAPAASGAPASPAAPAA
nr:MAG: internal scaffolding protein [Microvirus sp.]